MFTILDPRHHLIAIAENLEACVNLGMKMSDTDICGLAAELRVIANITAPSKDTVVNPLVIDPTNLVFFPSRA